MKNIICLLIILTFSTLCKSQELSEIVGKYTTKNKSHFFNKHYEEISLNADSSFRYFARIGFVKVEIKGEWHLTGYSLTLKGHHPGITSEVSVTELVDNGIPKGQVKIATTDLESDAFTHHVSATKGDTTITLRDREYVTMIPLSSLDRFDITNTLFKYPTYEVKNKQANYFKVRVPRSRVIINEVWQYKNGVLFPRGLIQDYSTYYLSKEESESN